MYKQKLKDVTQGAHAYSVRMALGALVIKELLGTSDQETVQQIAENPYLQYFLGLAEYQETCPFDVSSLTYFRRRIDADMIAQVNEWVVEAASSSSDEEDPPDDDHGGPSANSQEVRDQDAAPSDRPRYHQGKLLMDTTCTPADIVYPTDLKLLNNTREKLEAIINTMHEERPVGSVKLRTYRKKARKQYLAGAKKRRSAIHQQQTIFASKRRRIDHRIVRIAQPHVRPMVRGKAHAAVEFGAKMSVVVTNGWTHLDRLEWDAYHDSEDLPRAVEAYYDRHGHYPEAVLADQLYRTRENRRFCQKRKIRLSGPKLVRPSKETKEAAKHQA
ncbi:hypothetical protein ALCH109712_16985 [Alkalicoccus chagannorensis]